MTTLLPPRRSAARRIAGAVLRSPVGALLDGLAYPHGTDRYLELLDPLLARDTTRAVITDIQRETIDTATITLRPNRCDGHRAGQYVQVTAEVDGRRHTRCFSISSSAHRRDGLITITVKVNPGGIVSRYLANQATPGVVVELSPAEGEFVLPRRLPDRLLLISGGSGITPVMSMLRTLADEHAPTEITFLHYARTPRDLAFADELRELDARMPNLHLAIVCTREPDAGSHGLSGHLDATHLDAVTADLEGVPTYVCGPVPLIEAAEALWQQRDRDDLLHVERFVLAPITPASTEDATGKIVFADSNTTVDNDGTTLLQQAEAAGLTPVAGCRMGICHTCIRPKLVGQVRDVRDGRLSSCDPEQVQICISAPVGDVTIDL
jgi:stearoyl-CoA 9-desaturase NADPH oxidoreductase